MDNLMRIDLFRMVGRTLDWLPLFEHDDISRVGCCR